MPTAAAPKTAPALPLKLCAPVRSRLPELPIDYKLAVRQEDPHYGKPVYWKANWVSLYRCWWRPV